MKKLNLSFTLADTDDVDTFKDTYKKVLNVSSYKETIKVETEPKYLEMIFTDLIEIYGISDIKIG